MYHTNISSPIQVTSTSVMLVLSVRISGAPRDLHSKTISFTSLNRSDGSGTIKLTYAETRMSPTDMSDRMSYRYARALIFKLRGSIRRGLSFASKRFSLPESGY